MANSSINLVDLDFNSLKQSFKDYLTTQARFKDYNFDGSNISVLLDVLAYNSYLNSFYLNMVASEMFLDSAQLRDSVVSHAKELNYAPRSFVSAIANVNIAITPSTPQTSVVIPSKSSFTSRLGSNTFTFTTKESIVINTSNNGVFYANSVSLYEGGIVTDTFVKNTVIDSQRFILTNPNVDTTSIEVTVTENGGGNEYTYVQAYSLLDLTSTSQVFFVQACENEQYEIIFGNGTTGRLPKNGAIIEVVYRVSSGELPNGADNFINNSSIDGHSNVSITLNQEAYGGSISESINSIKFNAPRNFATQERAVTENDYKSLLIRKFPEIQSISVFGGEKENPPQYGKVFIAVDIQDSDGIPETNKFNYVDYLSDKVSLGITPVIVSPGFVYLSVESTVKYDYNNTTLSSGEIRSTVLNAISNFNDTYLDDFNTTFRFSNFVTAIDAADPSIINNDTFVNPYFLLSPTVNENSSFSGSFNTPIVVAIPSTTTHTDTDVIKGLYSSPFVVNGLSVIMEDDGEGNIRLVKVSSDVHQEISKVGTIDYSSGNFDISNINVSSYSGNGIKLFASPVSQDFSVTLKNILRINMSDVVVNLVQDRR